MQKKGNVLSQSPYLLSGVWLQQLILFSAALFFSVHIVDSWPAPAKPDPTSLLAPLTTLSPAAMATSTANMAAQGTNLLPPNSIRGWLRCPWTGDTVKALFRFRLQHNTFYSADVHWIKSSDVLFLTDTFRIMSRCIFIANYYKTVPPGTLLQWAEFPLWQSEIQTAQYHLWCYSSNKSLQFQCDTVVFLFI